MANGLTGAASRFFGNNSRQDGPFGQGSDFRRRLINLMSLRRAAKTAPTVEEELQRKSALFEFITEQRGGGLKARAQRFGAAVRLRQAKEELIETQQEEAPTIASRAAALSRRRRRLRSGRREISLLGQQGQGQQGPGGQLLV